jgi:hypothetical protein
MVSIYRGSSLSKFYYLPGKIKALYKNKGLFPLLTPTFR